MHLNDKEFDDLLEEDFDSQKINYPITFTWTTIATSMWQDSSVTAKIG